MDASGSSVCRCSVGLAFERSLFMRIWSNPYQARAVNRQKTNSGFLKAHLFGCNMLIINLTV
jgi:hypothetical protein